MVMMTGGNDVALVPMNKCWQHIFLNVKWPDQLNFNLNGEALNDNESYRARPGLVVEPHNTIRPPPLVCKRVK